MITAAGIVGSQAKIALGKVVSNILAMIDQIINSPDIDPAKVASWIRYGDFCISKIAGTYSKTEIPNVATAAIQRCPYYVEMWLLVLWLQNALQPITINHPKESSIRRKTERVECSTSNYISPLTKPLQRPWDTTIRFNKFQKKYITQTDRFQVHIMRNIP